MRARTAALASVLAGLLGPLGCAADTGDIELYWQFLDARGNTIAPSSGRRDSCALTGQQGDTTNAYDLEVRVNLADDCDDPGSDECPWLTAQRFSCRATRGRLADVPASETPMLVVLDVVVVPRGRTPYSAPQECIAVPGPRRRTITAGRTIDLAVNTLVVDAIDPAAATAAERRFDLDGCRPVTTASSSDEREAFAVPDVTHEEPLDAVEASPRPPVEENMR